MQYLSDYSQLARRAFDNQVHNSDRFGGSWLQGLDNNLSGQVSRLQTIGIRKDTIERYVSKYKQLVSAAFGAESRCASSFITGPAKFPVERMRKRRQSAQNRWAELEAYEARVMAAMERIARKEYKRENGITPLVEAQRNLNRRVQEQELMKKANATLRKAKSHEEREAALLDLGYCPEAIARLIAEPFWREKYGYEPWRLSNNNAQIVRLKERVEELKAKEYRAEQEDDNGPKRYEFEGGYVELNYTDDRLRIVHAEKPDAETIGRTDLLTSLKRIMIYANRTTHQIRLSLKANSLTISAEDLDYSNEANEKLLCEYDGDPMDIGFNAKLLSEVLSNLSAKMITLEMSAPNRAGLVIPVEQEENENITTLVMPVMLNTYA